MVVKHSEHERADGSPWAPPRQGFPHKGKRDFPPFLTHPKKTIVAAPEHCSVKTKQLRKKPYCKLGRSCTVLHNTQKTSDMSPLLALEISTQKWERVLRNVICPSWKAIRVPCYCHCSPLDQAQKQQQLEAVGTYKRAWGIKVFTWSSWEKGASILLRAHWKRCFIAFQKLRSSSFLCSWHKHNSSPVGRTKAGKILVTDTGAEKTPITDTVLMAVLLRASGDEVRCHSS